MPDRRCHEERSQTRTGGPLSQSFGGRITLAFLVAIKGVGNRPFYRWLKRDWSFREGLFPHLPERTRLFRLFKAHRNWTAQFLAEPTVFGVIDTYGIELIHPVREGRSPAQTGRKGLSNPSEKDWIVGSKLCLLLNKLGLVVAWDSATANVADNTFQPVVRQFEDQMIVFSDTAFHSKEVLLGRTNLKVCQRHQWNPALKIPFPVR